jgi:hypothetical protein
MQLHEQCVSVCGRTCCSEGLNLPDYSYGFYRHFSKQLFSMFGRESIRTDAFCTV